MKSNGFFAKHKKWIIPLLCVVVVIAIVLSGFAISEAVYRGGDNLEAEVKAENIYQWSKDDVFDLSDARYPSVTPKSGDGTVKILQLTDVHYRNQGTFGSWIGSLYITDGLTEGQIDKLVKETRPDLIVITGDLITYQGADHAYAKFIEFIDGVCEKYECFWTLTFGNHDAEYNRNKVALAEMMMASQYCLFDMGPTNFTFDSAKFDGDYNDGNAWSGLTGLGNFIIKVLDSEQNVRQVLFMMDSNDWVTGDYPDRKYSTPSAGYYPMQIAWYDWVCEGLKASNGGVPIPSAFFAHISPYRAPENSENSDQKKLNSDAYTAMTYDGITYDIQKSIENNGSTKYVFVGHTHYAGFTWKDESSGVVYTNGNKTGYNYNDSTHDTGGTLIELKTDGVRISHYHNTKVYAVYPA